MDPFCGISSLPSSSNPSGSSQAPSTRDSSPILSHDPFAMEQQLRQSLPSIGYANHQARPTDINQQTFQQNQQAFRAPRSVVSPNWRAATGVAAAAAAAAGEFGPLVPSAANYMLSSPARGRAESFNSIGLGGFAYCLDRGNGQFTRLIPADMLPAMNEIPATQTGATGMVILPTLPTAPPQGVANMNQPVTMKASLEEPGQVSSTLQEQIDQIVSTSSNAMASKREKVYCDKWIHDGTCAFTQQGCKFKHEMPFDKATQHTLGLFHGFPTWWKKQQAELQRQREVGESLPSPAREQTPAGGTGSNNSRQQPAPVLGQPGWRKEGGGTKTRSSSERATHQLEAFRPLPPAERCVWGPIEPPGRRGGVEANVLAGNAIIDSYSRGERGY